MDPRQTIQALGKIAAFIETNFNTKKYCSDREEILRNIASYETALRDKEETNKKFARNLRQTEGQFYEADRMAKEANLKLLTVQGDLKRKEEELSAVKMKLAKSLNKDGSQQTITDLQAQLQEKEILLAISSSEMLAKDELLKGYQAIVQNLNNERLLLFEHSQTLMSSLNANENMMADENKNLKMLMATKESELQQAKEENHTLAEMIFKLEDQVRRNHEVEMELQSYRKQGPKVVPLQQPPMQMPNSFNSVPFMNEMMENVSEFSKKINQENSHILLGISDEADANGDPTIGPAPEH